MPTPIRILHLEDVLADARLLADVLARSGLPHELVLARTRADFTAAIAGSHDVLISDSAVQDLDGIEALHLARARAPELSCIFLSASAMPAERAVADALGRVAWLQKDRIAELPALVARLHGRAPAAPAGEQGRADGDLVQVVHALAQVRTLADVMAIVRRAARALTGADGATFVLRDGDCCYYADEDAIAPLWKGRRFPLETCISGWVMLNKQPVAIEDIYADPRIPADAYRPTFVKSLVMVPIRTPSPIGAIGNYWAKHRLPGPGEIGVLQSLADTTAVAMENVRLYAELEQRVRERTAELEEVNRELESFADSVSHDLRSPLSAVVGYADLLRQPSRAGAPALDAEQRRFVEEIGSAGRRMVRMIDEMLELAKITRAELRRRGVDLGEIATELLTALRAAAPERNVDVEIQQGLVAETDERLVRVVLANLIGNAWKFTVQRERARIEFGRGEAPDGGRAYFVRDNGRGFPMDDVQRLFGLFQRVRPDPAFPGTGVGLASVKRAIQRLGGKVWAEAEPERGATFWFTLG